ncbi:helix-turn-helix domain-containing protein [Acutalibacter caecimuris]|uniref:helix-turn-helix domain-containing protein n=1 Tax=Acutalibacter caecimuris TaxID=3093657 RepID=UPI002AC90A09|nr:helix-turn-helix domain-containing protein [Acutalibacter sp. M00118]
MDREPDRGQYVINYFTSAKAERPANFFPLPNAIFHIGLSAGEIASYSYLMHYEDRTSHQCWPSYKTIGKAVGMGENTVRKYVHELWYKELIQIEPSKYELSGQIRNENLQYKILPIQQAIDNYNEGQLWK